MPYGQAPTAKPHSHVTVILAIVVAAIVAIAVAGILLSTTGGYRSQSGGGSSAYTVNITAVNWNFNEVSGTILCFQDQTDSGGIASGGSHFTTSIKLTAAFSGCKADNVSVSTQGFSLYSSNTPLTIINGPETLSVTVTTPDSGYVGVLTLVVQYTYVG